MNLKLPETIRSVQDLKALIYELKQYTKWAAAVDNMQRAGVSEAQHALSLSADAIDILRQSSTSGQLTVASLRSVIDALETYAATAPRCSITLAAMPSDSLKRQIVTWCRTNLNPNILVSFDFNATIAGGMVVRYGSHIHDWSFRRQILAARDHFPEILRHV